MVQRFLKKFNGSSMMKPSEPQFTIDADACPTGGGATDYHSYIAYDFPEKLSTMNISVLEALNCLVACRVFLTREKHSSTVRLRCDNMATIETFAKGSPRDKFLAAIARALWFCLACADVSPIFEHVPGHDMVIPDALSRMSVSQAYFDLASSIIKSRKFRRREIHGHHFDFHNFM